MSYVNKTIKIFYSWLQKECTNYSIFTSVFLQNISTMEMIWKVHILFNTNATEYAESRYPGTVFTELK